jgi:acyl-CoA reductase-like NAD-dependent aldehyde dehydrogenase
MREHRLPVAGERVSTGEWDVVVEPYSGDAFARVPLAGADEIDAALACAASAAGDIAALPTWRRVEILEGIVAGLRRRSDELAETIARESGKPIRFARAEVGRAVQTFTLAGDVARGAQGEVLPVDLQPGMEGYACVWRRFPIGPVSAISPFNFPLNLAAHKLAPAFAVGCPVVLKPPMQAPVTALLLADICFDAGLPRRALSAVHAHPGVAERLATDDRIRLLSFTGSDTVGWHLKSVAGRKKVVLELGGNAGAVVHGDTDVEWAAERCALGAFASAGQVCIKVQRLLVQDSVYDRFVERFLEAAGALPAGDPLDDATVIGPMIDTAAADRVMNWIDEATAAGARLLRGGCRSGNVIEPTVLAATSPSMKVERQEVFGPVVTVTRYHDFGDALRRVNASDFGLQAGVFTRDVDRIWQAFRSLEVGGVIANDYPTLRVDNFPYGGVKGSGLGREGPAFAAEDMTEVRTLVVRLAAGPG